MLKVLYLSRFSSELTIDLLFCDLFFFKKSMNPDNSMELLPVQW